MLRGNARPVTISSSVSVCISGEIHEDLSHAQHCNSNIHLPMLSCWNLISWSSVWYKHVNTTNLQLKFETWAKYLNNGKYIKCTRLAYVSGINIVSISIKMWARAYCPIVPRLASAGNSQNLLFSHDNFIRFPMNIFSGGMSPNNSWHNSSRFPKLEPVTSSPSIGTPNWSETSSRVTFVSPSGTWKVWVSILHLSQSTVTMRLLMFMLSTFKTWPKLVWSINILTLGSIKSVCFKIQIEWCHGRSTLSFPSQIWFVMWSSYWRKTDMFVGRLLFLAIMNYVKEDENINRISFKLNQ